MNKQSTKLDIAQKVRLFVAFVAFVALYFMFQYYGSDSNVAMESSSLWTWISIQWNGPDFKFCNFMIVFAFGVIWFKRKELAAAQAKPCPHGLLLLFFAMLLHYISFKGQMPRISLLASVIAFWSIPLTIWGWEVSLLLTFPALYILLCFCSRVLVEITMTLRLLASQLACLLLQGFGITTIRAGTVVSLPAFGNVPIDVADGCSGLRSLVVMTALAAPYAYFYMRGIWRKWALFLLSIPLAMLANALRIFTIGAVAALIGLDNAMVLYHDLSGYLVFIISCILLRVTGYYLEKNWEAKLCKLKEKKFSA